MEDLADVTRTALATEKRTTRGRKLKEGLVKNGRGQEGSAVQLHSTRRPLSKATCLLRRPLLTIEEGYARDRGHRAGICLVGSFPLSTDHCQFAAATLDWCRGKQ